MYSIAPVHPFHIQDPAGSQFARSWRITGATDLDPVTVDAIVDNVVPQIEVLPGYLGGYLFVEREHETIMTITFWDSREHRAAADVMAKNAAAGIMVVTSGDDMAADKLDVLIGDPPTQVLYRPKSG